MTAKRSRPAANRAAKDKKLGSGLVEIDSRSTRESDLDTSASTAQFRGEVR